MTPLQVGASTPLKLRGCEKYGRRETHAIVFSACECTFVSGPNREVRVPVVEIASGHSPLQLSMEDAERLRDWLDLFYD
jgi:hypothetical protein